MSKALKDRRAKFWTKRMQNKSQRNNFLYIEIIEIEAVIYNLGNLSVNENKMYFYWCQKKGICRPN